MSAPLDVKIQDICSTLLTYVGRYGWTLRALEETQKEWCLPPDHFSRLFPKGIDSAIEITSYQADEQMLENLEKAQEKKEKIRARIATAVRERLMVVADHRDVVTKTLSYLSLPQHLLLGCRCLYHTVDTIWYWAGDEATDFNFYTKRILLAGIYSATMLYWLSDGSPSYEKTWAFLERRLENVLALPKALPLLKETRNKALSLLKKVERFLSL